MKDLQLGILRKVVTLTDRLICWEEGDASIFEIIDAIVEDQDTLIENLKVGPSETKMLTTNKKDESNHKVGIIRFLGSLVQEKDNENDTLRNELRRKSEELKESKNSNFYNVVKKLLKNTENTENSGILNI